jgi:hypothetical protein
MKEVMNRTLNECHDIFQNFVVFDSAGSSPFPSFALLVIDEVVVLLLVTFSRRIKKSALRRR